MATYPVTASGARVRRRRGGWLWATAAGLVIAGTGWGFLATNANVAATIMPATGLPGGMAATLTPVDSTVTHQPGPGPAAVDAGVELYRIHVGQPADSNRLWVTFAWLNPNAANRVLHNPSAFINVGLYYPVSSVSLCPTTAYTIDDPKAGSSLVCQEAGPQTTAEFNASIADGVLKSTQANETYLYLVASITTPGHAPPGQQLGAATLQYFAEVHGL